MRDFLANMPTTVRTVIGVVVLIGLFSVCNGFGASGDVELTAEEAIEIATPVVDFVPTESDARLLRQGFSNIPVWSVALSIPVPSREEGEYQRIMIVNVDARNGDVIEIFTDQAVQG